MIRRPNRQHPRQRERGVTMLLVAIAMMSMLAMLALAIDVITLYSARSETQRVADAAALAAAKVLVDSGSLTDPTYQPGAQLLAAQAAKDIGTQLSIAARPVQPADVTVSFGGANFNSNPNVTVTVQNTFLPAFFSRIFNRTNLTVTATATAEAFSPSGSGVGVPVVPRCVKPVMVPNCDPMHAGAACGAGTTFFDPVSGAITNPGVAPTGVIGEQFEMYSNCGPGPGCAAGAATVGPGPGGTTLYYYPVQLPTTTDLCPSCYAGTTNFEQDTACCNPTPISCGSTATLPAVNQLSVDTTVNPEAGSTPAQSGIECLIHQRPGNGQDNLLAGPPLTYPLQIQVGNNHPLAGFVLSTNDLVTTSDSLVTLPVYDPNQPGENPPGVNVNVIGFLQVFIQQTFPGGGGPKLGEFRVTVVNVLGCGNAASGAPVSSAAAVPVRLIHQ